MNKQAAAKYTPETFIAAFPRYVYRNHKGTASVQWRQAALEITAERDALRSEVTELRKALDDKIAGRLA